MPLKAGWRRTLPVHTMRVSMPGSLHVLLEGRPAHARLRAQQHREQVPHAVQAVEHAGQLEHVGEAGQGGAPGARRCGAGGRGWHRACRSCTRAKAADSSDGSRFQPTSSKMKRLSYSRPSSRFEKNRVSTPRVEPNSCTSERRPQRRSSRQRSASASSSTSTMPPVPAAVMMCDRAKLVTLMSARAPVGVPRRVGPRASHESSTSASRAFVGQRPQGVPVGRVADEVGHQDRLRAVGDGRVDEGRRRRCRCRLDVDEGGHGAGPHQRGHVGGEGQHRGDDLVPGLELEEGGGQLEGRGAGVAHDPPALARQRGDLPLEGADVAPDAEGRGPAPQHLDDGGDLLLVVDAAGVGDPACHGSRLKTRTAFSRRNFGQTWSRKGTPGSSAKMRSRLSPMGK